MSSKLKPAIWSHDTGHWIPCFDSCQLTITWMSDIIYVRCKPRQQCSCGMAAMFSNVVIVGCPCPWSMPLATLTMKNQWHGFLCMCMVLFINIHSYEAPPELCYDELKVTNHKILGARHLRLYEKSKFHQSPFGKSLLPVAPKCFKCTALS